MRSYKTTVVVNAPVEGVWGVLADVLRWPQWLPTVTSVQALGAEELAIGARYRLVQPKLPTAVWSVVELVPHSRFDWESRSPGVRVRASHVISPVTSHSTRLSNEVAFTGPLAGLVALVSGRLTREYIEREAASLKQRVESMSV